jgi:hydroxyacylglutathione hydrolase
MNQQHLSVSALPAFSDNYIWLLNTGAGACALVDPGDADVVIDHLDREGLELDSILVTHHHPDHIGGIASLLKHWPATVWGPADDRISLRHRTVGQGDRVELDRLDLAFEVLSVPGHTRSHIAYFGHGKLFSGDTLFSAGCGRLFEGTPDQMQASLDKLAALPGSTEVYCAHEYTQANVAFALAVEPESEPLCEFAQWVDRRRASGEATIPSTLERERAINPFLRSREPRVVARAREIEAQAQPGATTLGVIRRWKDRFTG